jgi:hypothetical protein
MSTSSSDSTYIPPDASVLSSDDDFSANASEDLSLIYANDDPSDLNSDPFDIMNYETSLSQQAFLNFQELDHQVNSALPPERHDEFKGLLTNAVKTNQDPATLQNIVRGWMSPHP